MTCRKFPLDTAFIPMQVPPNATLSGPLFLGSSSAPGMGVLVNNWLGELPNNGEPGSSRKKLLLPTIFVLICGVFRILYECLH